MKLEQANTKSIQELADYAVAKIVEQGGMCINNDGLCKYGDGARHCPIGWMLDKGDEVLMVFKGGVCALVNAYPDRVPDPIKNNIDIAGRLQVFHDAKKQDKRQEILDVLSGRRLDTSAPHWRQWVEMGDRV